MEKQGGNDEHGPCYMFLEIVQVTIKHDLFDAM